MVASTNYKNSKLNKNYIKPFKIYKINPPKFKVVLGRLLAFQEQWRRVLSTRRRKSNRETG
jgi:hypothetical protein